MAVLIYHHGLDPEIVLGATMEKLATLADLASLYSDMKRDAEKG